MRKAKKPEVPALLFLLLHDPCGPYGSWIDWNPFGGFLLNEDGLVQVVGSQFRAYIPQREWASPEDFDEAVLSMLTKAAKTKPAGIIPVHEKDLSYTLSCASTDPTIPVRQIIGSPKTIARAKTILKPEQTKDWRFWETEHRMGRLLLALPYPELVGRITGPSLTSMGACVFAPETVFGVRLLPN